MTSNLKILDNRFQKKRHAIDYLMKYQKEDKNCRSSTKRFTVILCLGFTFLKTDNELKLKMKNKIQSIKLHFSHLIIN